MKIVKKVKRFRRHHNPNKIKIRQSYSTHEIAELLGVHHQTVISWYATGLKKIDALQPSIVFGQDLINFINDKNSTHKHKCADNELFCCKCKRASKASENKVSIKSFKGRANLMGKCEKCGTQIFKTISPESIESYKKIFVVVPEHEKDLIECNHASTTTSKNEKE